MAGLAVTGCVSLAGRVRLSTGSAVGAASAAVGAASAAVGAASAAGEMPLQLRVGLDGQPRPAAEGGEALCDVPDG